MGAVAFQAADGSPFLSHASVASIPRSRELPNDPSGVLLTAVRIEFPHMTQPCSVALAIAWRLGERRHVAKSFCRCAEQVPRARRTIRAKTGIQNDLAGCSDGAECEIIAGPRWFRCRLSLNIQQGNVSGSGGQISRP
jgi:hypothetical protein